MAKLNKEQMLERLKELGLIKNIDDLKEVNNDVLEALITNVEAIIAKHDQSGKLKEKDDIILERDNTILELQADLENASTEKPIDELVTGENARLVLDHITENHDEVLKGKISDEKVKRVRTEQALSALRSQCAALGDQFKSLAAEKSPVIGG